MADAESLPTRQDLVGEPPYTLDEHNVLRNFLGKTREEVRTMFPAASYLTEDFMWMAEAGLNYFLPSALDYLQSPDSDRDFDFAAGLLCSLAYQIETHRLAHKLVELIKSIAGYVKAHQDKFAINPDVQVVKSYFSKIESAGAIEWNRDQP